MKKINYLKVPQFIIDSLYLPKLNTNSYKKELAKWCEKSHIFEFDKKKKTVIISKIKK